MKNTNKNDSITAFSCIPSILEYGGDWLSWYMSTEIGTSSWHIPRTVPILLSPHLPASSTIFLIQNTNKLSSLIG